jgi:DNA-binding NarL/FixJ family response regulator
MTTTLGTKRRVLLVDDHPIVRQGLRRMLEAEADLTVCAEADSEAAAREAIRVAHRAQKPDIVVVDLSLDRGDGIELVREMHAEDPQLRMLVLSMHDETIYAERLLAAGAMGYIMKQAASDQLLTAVRKVLDGRMYVSETVQRTLDARAGESRGADPTDPVSRLSNREVQILNMVGRGMSSRDIATEFGLSVKTIESHRQTIKHKLGLATNSQLLQYAMKWFSGQHRG